MVHETELPCTTCGTALHERSIEGAEGSTLTVAACPECGARYYPESTLREIGDNAAR